MIRKAIIILLTLGGVGVLVVGVWSLMTVGMGRNLTLWHSAHWTLDVEVYKGHIGVHSATSFAGSAKDGVAFQWSYMRFGYHRAYFSNASVQARRVYFPFWAVVLILGAYPAIALIRQPARRRRYRREHGLCVKCGYDLTGNVSGVCPECGAEVKQP
jgi:hypothetical protein